MALQENIRLLAPTPHRDPRVANIIACAAVPVKDMRSSGSRIALPVG